MTAILIDLMKLDSFIYTTLLKNNVIISVTNKTRILVINSNTLYFFAAHLRLSTFFYNTALTCITGADVLNNNTLVIYIFLSQTSNRLLCCTLHNNTKTISSINTFFQNSSWYEREVSEFFDIKFLGSLDSRTLLLPYNNTTAPLKKNITTNSTSVFGFCKSNKNLCWYNI